MNDLEPTRGRGGGNRLHDLARMIGGAIIDCDDLVVVVFECKQASERGLNVSGFITRGNNNADARIARRLAVPLRVRDIGNFGHADGCVGETPQPDQAEGTPCNPVEIIHPADVSGAPGCPCLSVPTAGANLIP